VDAAARVLSDELRAIGNSVRSGDTPHLLKTLDERGTAEELVQREYGGRYVFELLQNANDAAGTKGSAFVPHRVRLVITDDSLLFANQGQGFQADNVHSICTLGRSSKDPRKTLGYKGLGFKAVGELTDHAQIISPPYRFGFNAQRARQEVAKLTGPLPRGQRLPAYAFPFPIRAGALGDDDVRVAELLEDGFVTVIRLPFRDDVSAADVASDVRAVVGPELLLFLDATTEISVAWPGGSLRVFRSEPRRLGEASVVSVGQDDEAGRPWLVFRAPEIAIPNTALVEALDRSWHRVRRVSASIAFPLAGERLATGMSDRPASVYFPTETRTGLGFVVNADFYLDLDRRHVSETPQARPYNEWLARRIGAFFERSVLPGLTRLYPHDFRVVHACGDAGTATGFGQFVADRLREGMARSRFVPVSAGVVTPGKASRSPVPASAAAAFHRFFDGPALGAAGKSLVDTAVETDERSRRLVTSLGAPELTDDVVLRALRTPPAIPSGDLPDFYILLESWIAAHPSAARPSLVGALKHRPLLYSFDRRWVDATGPVFFPRSRSSADLPAEFPGNILHVDSIGTAELVQRFLVELGVQPFRWREVILTSLLPVLRDHPTERQIEAAHEFLRRYYDEERGGDQEVSLAVGQVPVRARALRRRRWERRAARDTYFARDWVATTDLEDLYGPFGLPEFLAEPVPDDGDAKESARSFFLWLGVADRPRSREVQAAVTSSWMPPRPDDVSQTSWRSYAAAIRPAVMDPQGHPQSQHLRTDVLDRVDDLLRAPTPKQGEALLRQLALHFDEYEPSLHGEVRCRNGQHSGERSRVIDSYTAFALRQRAWVPAHVGGAVRLLRAGSVWLTGADAPRRVGQLLPQVRTEGYPPGVERVAATLGFIDPQNAGATEYAGLLRDLPSEFPLPAPAVIRSARKRQLYEEQTVELARWVMRNLNVALANGSALTPVASRELPTLPLLATRDGARGWEVGPIVVDDPRLARRLERRFAWFLGERTWFSLIAACKLRRLTSVASVRPIHGDELAGPTRDLGRRVVESSPYVLALLEADAPSELAQARGRIGRFGVKVVEHLTLKVAVNDPLPDELFISGDAFLEEDVVAGAGSVRAAHGTYYCTETAVADYYRLGGALADFLVRPGLGDAMSIVLRSGRDERMRFLTSKAIDAARVKAMRELLGRPEEDDEIVDFGAPAQRGAGNGSGSDGHSPGPGGAGAGAGRHAGGGSQGSGTGSGNAPPPELPALDTSELEVVTAVGGAVHRREGGDKGGAGGKGGGSGQGHPNWAAMEEMRRRYGKRGEEAVFAAERKRVSELGIDEDRVLWISRDDEGADHDLESLDADGVVIYIEVKSTTSADPSEPFPIRSRELRFGARHRDRYFIYRVTNVRDARPSITRYQDPIGLWELGNAETEVTEARMWLPKPEAERPDDPQ
jgi:hypothetical protein